MARNKKKKDEPIVTRITQKLKQTAIDTVNVPLNIFQKICYWIGFSVMFMFAITCLVVFLFFQSLPNISDMSFEDMKKHSNKVVLEKLEDKSKKYKWVDIKNVNRDYLFSVVMSEDGKYFEHDGINYGSLMRSLAVNIKKKKIVMGGSTISQQVTKNLFLDQSKSIIRKLKEYFITRSMEAKLTKNQILELYLNIVEVGPDLYGINAASHEYFKKSPSKINAAEGAFIAIMLPSPRRYHYSIFKNKNLTKRHKKKITRILGDMKFNEYISPAQYNKYLKFNYFK